MRKTSAHAVAGIGVVALLVVAAGGLLSPSAQIVSSETSHSAIHTTVGEFHVRVYLAPGDKATVVLPCGDNQTGRTALGHVWSQDSDEIRYVVNFMLSSDVPAEISQTAVTLVTWKDSANRSDAIGKEWGVGGGGNLMNAYTRAGILIVDQEVSCPHLTEGAPLYLAFVAALSLAGGGQQETTTEVAITKDMSTMQSRFSWDVTATCPLPPCLK